MTTALIGLGGILLGIVITEVLRRINRVETYAQTVFEKRLAIYEGLYDIVNDGYEKGMQLIDRTDLSSKEATEIWSDFIFQITGYTDRHSLYLDERIIVHCITTFFSVPEIAAANLTEKEQLQRDFSQDYKIARHMIKQATGLEKIDKTFFSITGARPSSRIVTYFERRRKQTQP